MDSQPGVPYTPTLTVLDANGSPVTSGVTGVMSLYGPSSLTALTTGALSHQGYGEWGYTFGASNFTQIGTYRFNVPSLVTPGGTLLNQGGEFVVGVGDFLTLREIYTRVRRALRDGWTGTTTDTGTTTTLISSRFAWGSPNSWVDSEILVLEPANTTDLNPVRVTGFDETSGTFTFANQPLSLSSTASGVDFIIGNKENQGFTHDEVLDAITGAMQRARALRQVSDQYVVTSAYNTFEYPIANSWVAIDAVEYQPDAGTPTFWQPIPPAYYRHIADRGVLRLDLPMPNNAVRIIGRALPALPATMGDLVQADAMTVRDDALFELLSMSDDQGDRQRAAMFGPGVMRARAGAGLARL